VGDVFWVGCFLSALLLVGVMMILLICRSNLARPRFIPKQATNGVKVHRSVKLRMEAEYEDAREKGEKYDPRAHFHVEPTWID
jgi:hypothetical protein